MDINHLKQHNATLSWHAMAHPVQMQHNPPKVIVRAEEVFLTDVDGHKTLDAVGGLWNANLGYSCQPVKDAISRQLSDLPYYSTFRGSSNDQFIELSVELKEWFATENMQRSFFTLGGSDSVESALRLARQYWKIKGEAGRYKFLALKKGYHGTHYGAASVNGNANFRSNYEPMMPGVFHIPAPWTYRNPFDEQDPQKLADRCLSMLRAEIEFQGANTICAFIMEPVLGAGGVIVPHESFMPGVKELCEQYDILFIADEVITAFGRTGAWSGSRLWGVEPDLMCIAKAISNAYFPMGAVMIGEKLTQTFESNNDALGAIGHGYTYSGHPVGCAAALATLAETKRLKVVDNVNKVGTLLQAGIRQLLPQFEQVGDVRGIGLMAAIEVVNDKASKQPADNATMQKLFNCAYEAGVMVRVSGNTIILSPPLVINASHVEQIMTALKKGFTHLSE